MTYRYLFKDIGNTNYGHPFIHDVLDQNVHPNDKNYSPFNVLDV